MRFIHRLLAPLPEDLRLSSNARRSYGAEIATVTAMMRAINPAT